MPYQLFNDLFPETAERETRTITVPEDSDPGMPCGHYSFPEMFRNEPGCDRRRVFFHVVSSSRKDVEAVVAWGWETPDFHAKWMKDDDPHVVADLKVPTLNLSRPRTNLAPAILDLGPESPAARSGVRYARNHRRVFTRRLPMSLGFSYVEQCS